jgi:hypothetical protein
MHAVAAPITRWPIAGVSGILQVDGYVAYDKLASAKRTGGPLRLAFCWGHVRRRFYGITNKGDAPIATEALLRIAALYAIEVEINGRSAEPASITWPSFHCIRISQSTMITPSGPANTGFRSSSSISG